MTVPLKQPETSESIEALIAQGDLSKLTPPQRNEYYIATCKSLGLNPLTKPFEYIVLNNRLTLYCTRGGTDQLRKINNINLQIVSQEVSDGLLTVHVRAKTPDGREDEDVGSVAFGEQVRGEARANLIMKAVTKAKRRTTLSICGLGWLDESEIADIPASAKRPPPPAPNVLLHNPETGEITAPQEPSPHDVPPAEGPAASAPPAIAGAAGALSVEAMAREAAQRGREHLAAYYRTLPPEGKRKITLMKTELEGLYPHA